MLATRPYETEHSHWPFGKYPPSRRSSASPRMSDHYGHPLPTQPDWQGQYPYLPPSGAAVYSQTSESSHAAAEVAHSHQGTDEGRPPLSGNQHHPLDRQRVHGADRSSQMSESPEVKGESYGSKSADLPLSPSMASVEPANNPSSSHLPHSISSLVQNSSEPSREYGQDDHVSCSKEDGDNILDEEDMIEGEAETLQPQTTAERVAARRKMKRFRLTHSQTRFLTSEFAKQPHPDAAHRERLSREIPGLSPRQVQVWFQNRRAKIKRLNADDRERMIKMRAVPDDFDNVQALHSPYGAMNMPLAPPVDFTNPSYANPMMRPLMVDIRRQDGSDQVSPTGLAPSFSNIGFNSASGVISPLSPSSNDRYTHSGHLSTALTGGHGSLDSAMQSHRPGIRPIQPFNIRDVMSRPRSESLQSPLRPGIPWKTDSMDYYMYQGLGTSQTMADRPPLVYQPGQLGQAPSSGIGGLDRSSYSSSSTTQPSPGLSYSTFQSAAQNGSRVRAASASSVSLGMDNQYRETGSGLQSPKQMSGSRPPAPPSHYSGSSAYTMSYTPASLTAPLDSSSQSRPPNTSTAREYSDGQMSMPTNDYPPSMQSNLSSQDTRIGVREMFHNGSMEYNHNQERTESFGDDLGSSSFKRSRSYSLSGGPGAPVSDLRSQPHGNTT